VADLVLAARVLVGGVLVVAAWSKLRPADARRDFAGSVRDSLALPAGVSWIVAALVGPAELAAAGLLAFAPTSGAGGLLAAVLLLAFTAVVVRVLVAGRAVRCRCFGSGGTVFGPRHVGRNLLLAAAALAVWAGTGTPDPVPAGPGAATTALALATGALAALVVVRADDVRAGLARTPEEVT
jgi:hypothetical protein